MFDNSDIKPLEEKVWLSSPTMHGEELEYMKDAYISNWMSTVGKNISEVEQITCSKMGCDFSVALSSGTAALHMAIRMAGIELYGRPSIGQGAVQDQKVFCSTLTFGATVNPIVYEGGVPVFIDSEEDTWNMDPIALEKAFELYPEVKIVVIVHLYGTPAKMDEIKNICKRYGAVIIEDAAESLGAVYKGTQTGNLGKYNCISFNGNKIITGSAGGMFLTNVCEAAKKVRKWSTQARENAPWYQHEEIGYNYRMSNVIAGVVRGQFAHLEEHIAHKKAIYEKYKKEFENLPLTMNPFDEYNTIPNYWLSCIRINSEAMCKQVRSDKDVLYIAERGKSCPTEIYKTLGAVNIESRPIWKPMHMQPLYQTHEFVTRNGSGRAMTDAYNLGSEVDISKQIFNQGLCLPSDIKMTTEEQDLVIDIVRKCFS